ncbi:MAG: tRNA (adenosine(37)-N6)-dimethylallyltransferase MiaA [Proteobacteria bacterium]|nr:tRNA (adenosine(37)-N6)-dimethylallyltransferase MiaA [Pseudomonadota bacterium]
MGDPGPPVIVLMGPTAAGKSDVALALAAALDGEIVSVDSAQVYRGMDIGTAKPDTATRARVAHHLVDVIDPDASYSAARFCADAEAALADIAARGRAPIVAGGTMLYFKALTEGLSSLPVAAPAVRAALDARAAADGWPALHAELARVDPATAARLAPTDAQRIQRALEVHIVAGVPLSSLQARRAAPAGRAAWLRVALVPGDRARLHRDIETRFDRMIAAGLVDELAALRRRYALSADMPSMRSVGYRQAYALLDGSVDVATFRAQAIAATRQLAKRQFTWLRATDAVVLDPQIHTPDALATRIAALAADR